jgi:hypothetical protein
VPEQGIGVMEGVGNEEDHGNWANDVEEDMKIMGMRNWYRVAGDKGERRGLYWKRRSTPECSAGGGGRVGWEVGG